MTHTPWPWRVRKPSAYAPDSVYEIETDKPNESHGETIAAITKGSSNSNANAKLIAAAPDLLHALYLLTNSLYIAGLNNSAEHHTFIEKARLAIAKAIGEEP